MKRTYHFSILFLLLNIFTGCNGQTKVGNNDPATRHRETAGIVGGGCDGCQIMYVGMPSDIRSIDTSAGWFEKGTKMLVTGTVFKLDGKTPAKDVIIYYWQTDNDGYYSPLEGMDERARRHGHIRGWVKTDSEGQYRIYTIRPTPYPNENIPAHIHLSIKEPDLENEYYTDEINFDDDKLLIPLLKKYPPANRGGSGIVRVLMKGDMQVAEHDIVLGLNVPNYPIPAGQSTQSGLPIGEDQPSFMPYHAYGPDKGTRTCPVCKYGRFHGVVYFVGNKPDWTDIKKWLGFLEKESVAREKYLKVYFVYGNEKSFNEQSRQRELEQVGKELQLQHVALTYVPSFSDIGSESHLNRIDPDVENTFIIYKRRRIVDKYVNIKASVESFRAISETLDRTRGEYFDLAEVGHD